MYQPKVYKDSGGDRQVIAAGGILRMEPGSLIQYANPTGAADYYVDGNVSATGDGSIDSPYLTLAEAITASNTSIGLTANRWWARRNRIFVMGDQEIDEDLTTGAEKCDIVGVGTDLLPFPRILGNHIFTTKCTGMRLINLGFMATAATALLTFPDLNHGWQLIGCEMWPFLGGSTHAVRVQGCAHWKVLDCRIRPNVGDSSLFAEGIKQEVGSAQGHDNEIAGNYIRATEGIHALAGVSVQPGEIHHNRIHATALTVNDESGLWEGYDNRLISDADSGADALGAIVATKSLWSGNKVTGVAGTEENADYPFPVQFTS